MNEPIHDLLKDALVSKPISPVRDPRNRIAVKLSTPNSAATISSKLSNKIPVESSISSHIEVSPIEVSSPIQVQSPIQVPSVTLRSYYENSATLAYMYKVKSSERGKAKVRDLLNDNELAQVGKESVGEYEKISMSLLSLLARPSPYNDTNSFHLPLITKLTNMLMKNGKKSTAEKILQVALKIMKTDKEKHPLLVVKAAFQNSRPYIQNYSRRQKGRVRQFPKTLEFYRQSYLGLSYLINPLRDKTRINMGRDLYEQLMAAAANKGKSRSILNTTYKTAKDNIVFLNIVAPTTSAVIPTPTIPVSIYTSPSITTPISISLSMINLPVDKEQGESVSLELLEVQQDIQPSLVPDQSSLVLDQPSEPEVLSTFTVLKKKVQYQRKKQYNRATKYLNLKK